MPQYDARPEAALAGNGNAITESLKRAILVMFEGAYH